MVEASLSSTFGESPNGPPTSKKTLGIFQDAITVNIPIGVTADLGVAFRRTRNKRIAALYQAFPSLKEKKAVAAGGSDDEENNEDGGESDEMEGTGDSGLTGGDGDGEKKKKAKKDKKPKAANDLVPQREQFGSIMDYLEAKYTRGVMIHDEDELPGDDGGEDGEGKSEQRKDDDDEEGQGSVYSETSFLDDRDLQRDVAEQVLAQTTTTTLEGDDDFFVNVGELDVEETELTQKHYDPLEDSPTKTKPATKKRKKPSATKSAATKTASPAAKKKTTPAKKKDDEPPTKKKKSALDPKKAKAKAKSEKSKAKKQEKADDDSDSSPEEAMAATTATAKKGGKKDKEKIKELKKIATKYKKIMEKRFESIKKRIKDLTKEELPRKRPQKSKVSITCPANKKEGDEVTFA